MAQGAVAPSLGGLWPKEVLLDSGLMSLWVIGLHDPSLIRRHKRTQDFDEQDFDRLSTSLGRARRIWVTPNVLTEVSNLIGQIGEPVRSKLLLLLSKVIQGVVVEIYRESARVAAEGLFSQLGLTDTGFFLLDEKPLVITADGKLAGILLSRGIPVFWFRSLDR